MDEDLEMDYLELRRLRNKKLSSYVKSAATFLFSHVGLAAMVIGYSIMGGFLFKALEAPNETKEKLRIRSFKESKIVEIRQLADLLCVRSISPDNFTELVNIIQLQFQQQVTLAVKNNGWDGKDETDEAALQWSFAGSLLYAVTVITTIGYGHVAPKTTAGRLVTILYALVGIPLTFLYLSNMGNFMAECFRLFYKKICCGICVYFMDSEPKDSKEEDKMEMVTQRNFAFMDPEEEDKADAGYRNVVILCPGSTSDDTKDDEPATVTTDNVDSARPILKHNEDICRRTPTDSLRTKDQQHPMENHTGCRKDASHDSKAANKIKGAEQSVKRDSVKRGKRASSVGEGVLSSKKVKRQGLSDAAEKSSSQLRPVVVCGNRRGRRRLSLESGIDMAEVSSPAKPLMLDKSVETSVSELLSDVLSAASSSVGPRSGVSGDMKRSTSTGLYSNPQRPPPTPSPRLVNGGHRESSPSELYFNSSTIETSFTDSKDCMQLRTLRRSSSMLRALENQTTGEEPPSSFQLQNEDDDNETKFNTEVSQRRESEDEDQQRLMYSRMMARQRSMQTRSDDDLLDDSQVTVPISICLIIIGVYIFGGSLLFTMWEDWDYLTGSYFCFVTLSTIGFGDIVPGTDMKEWAAHQKLILCSLWLVVGLSLLAMCFNLMQEEVKDWCKWVGQKLGILKEE